MHEDNYLNHGAIIENAMVYPNGDIDFDDDRLTPNSRGSYPLSFLSNIKESSVASHPHTIIFLTADAYGVLPPISKLSEDSAMFWFLMGYTSKLAGTETGIIEPVATFSRFFGQPFMPVKPEIYAKMLGEKMKKYETDVYLVNTGWVGGKYGQGSRISLKYTRSMVKAAIYGELKDVEYEYDEIFKLEIPKTCPGVPSEVLNQKKLWENEEEYLKSAKELAEKFKRHFLKTYSNLPENIKSKCPGL
jgi:phosphoenolpyruvate carboxykinase (ATP)